MGITIGICITILYLIWAISERFKVKFIFWAVAAAFAGVLLVALGSAGGEMMGFLTALIYTWFLIVLCAGIILKKIDKMNHCADEEKNSEEQE